MELKQLVERIDARTARAFVSAARNVMDALVIEAEHVRRAQTPGTRDYGRALLPRSTPAGGWLTPAELRETSQRLAEALAAEKWTEGVLFAMRVLGVMGGGL